MEGKPSEHMPFKEFCVAGVDLELENPSERMEGGGNIKGMLLDVLSIEEIGQSQGSTSTNNEVMSRY